MELMGRRLRASTAGLVLVGAAVAAFNTSYVRAQGHRGDTQTSAMASGIPDNATVLEFAQQQGITTQDAESAFRDTTAILNFKVASSKDPRFGDVWVDYQDRYRVHVRSLDASFGREIDRLERHLGRPVVRHEGGASAGDMEILIRELRRQAPTVGWKTNIPDGVVEVYESGAGQLPPDLLASPFVRVIPGSAPVLQPLAG